MTHKLCRRLEGLEKISAAAACRSHTYLAVTPGIERVKAMLDAYAADPRNREALIAAEADLPRRMRELRAQLMERAYGGCS